MDKLMNIYQVDAKSSRDGSLHERYICVEHESKNYLICARATYGDNNKLLGILGEYNSTIRNVTQPCNLIGLSTEVSNIGSGWYAEHDYRDAHCDKLYPSKLECYFNLPYRYVIIPISDTSAIYVKAHDSSGFVSKTPVIFFNRIIGDSIKMPNNVMVDLLKRTLLGEKNRLSRCKVESNPNSPSLDEAINYLDSFGNLKAEKIPQKVKLKGIPLIMYHLSIITVIEHLIDRIENDRYNKGW